MPADGLVVRITITGDESRELALEPLGERGRELAAAWGAAARGRREDLLLTPTPRPTSPPSALRG
jgi:hypothetical protein